MTYNVEYMLICHLFVFFREVSVQVFYSFCKTNFHPPMLLSFKSSPSLWLFFFILFTVSFVEQKFWILINLPNIPFMGCDFGVASKNSLPNLSSSIPAKVIEYIFKNLHKDRTIPCPDDFTNKFYQIFKR